MKKAAIIILIVACPVYSQVVERHIFPYPDRQEFVYELFTDYDDFNWSSNNVLLIPSHDPNKVWFTDPNGNHTVHDNFWYYVDTLYVPIVDANIADINSIDVNDITIGAGFTAYSVIFADPNGDISINSQDNANFRFIDTNDYLVVYGMNLKSATATRLIATDANKVVISADIYDWLSPTTDQTTLTDDGDGTATFGTVQDINESSDVIFGSVTLTKGSHFLLLETGDNLLLQTGSNFMLSYSVASTDSIVYMNDDGRLRFGEDLTWDDDTQQMGVNGTIFMGDGGTTNYTEVETDGTLEFNGTATVWNDINVGAMMLTLPASGLPDEDEFVDENGDDTGIATWAYAIGEHSSGSVELPHDYKEGSDIYFHIHWQGIAAPGGGTDNVNWQLTYTVAQVNETLDAPTTISKEIAIDVQYDFKLSDFAAITGTNFNIGDQFLFTIERIAASADDYGGDCLLATVGLHYECDTVGSRQIVTK